MTSELEQARAAITDEQAANAIQRLQHSPNGLQDGQLVKAYLRQQSDRIAALEAEVSRLQGEREAVQFWKAEHVRIYDYNRYGTLAFTGLPEQFPDNDVLQGLAAERKRFTLVMYMEDYKTPSDRAAAEQASRQHDDGGG